MILGKRKAVAALAASAIVASGAMWAPAAAQPAPVCQDVPVATTGGTVKVGPVEERIPALSEVRICGQGPSAAPYRVASGGGSCLYNCYSVYVGGGTVTVGSLNVTWKEDGVGKSSVFNPSGVALPAEQCLISTGAPEAAEPDCFIAVGVDQFPDVTKAVDDAVQTAIEQVTWAQELTCDEIPDMWDPNTGQYADFCTNSTGWTNAATNYGYDATCSLMPPAYSDWGYEYRFCDDPYGWTFAVVDDTYEMCNGLLGPQYDPDYPWWYEGVYFCDDPILWTQRAVENFCNNLCDTETLNAYIQRVRALSQEQIRIHIG